MGARKIESLVLGLPPDCATYRSHDEAVRVGWGWNEELLATIAELVDWGNRHFLAANGVKSHQLPRPLEINRPLEKKVPRRKATAADFQDMMPVITAEAEKET